MAAVCVALAGALPVAGAKQALAATETSSIKAQEAGIALSRGNALQAVSLFTEALAEPQLANERRAVILNDRGVAYMRVRQYKAAIEDFNKAVLLYPEYAASYNNRGNLLMALGQPAESIKDFDRAILLSPAFTSAFNNRANANVKLGQLEPARADFARAIELSPNIAAPYNGRGRLQLAVGRPSAALRDFSRAVNIDGKYGIGYRNRAEANMALDRFNEAVEDYSRAIVFDPNSPDLYVARGNAYLAAANYSAANKDYSKAAEIDPRLAVAYEMRGLANARAGAFDDALNDFSRAIEINHRNPGPFAKRALTYKDMNQSEAGLRDVERALKLDPKHAESLWVRGEIALGLERRDDAIADFRAALAANSGQREAANALFKLTGEGRPDEEQIPGGRDGWKIVRNRNFYFSVNDKVPGVRVPLETVGSEPPRILEFEQKKPPFKGIGVLRFHLGKADGKKGPEDYEEAAIIDLQSNAMVAVEPVRQGSAAAQWNWADGKLTVVSFDGLTDEFTLRLPEKPVVAERPRPESSGREAREAREARAERAERSERRSKPKSLFDLIFGN